MINHMCGSRHFNPLSPHGERPCHPRPSPASGGFQSTLPTRGETRAKRPRRTRADNFNPLSPHGERQDMTALYASLSDFNPLSPHGERLVGYAHGGKLLYFNPLSPHGERLELSSFKPFGCDFNPLSPHGERPSGTPSPLPTGPISIHSPHTGRDASARRVSTFRTEFQSTLPTRGETHLEPGNAELRDDFNPLSPHGERRWWCWCWCYS